MPVRLSDIKRWLLRRPTPQPCPTSPRTRLEMTALEDRVVPTAVVRVEWFFDAAEGGPGGLFQFVRTEDTSGPLTVHYTVGGTATPGTDYTALSGTVEFVAGAMFAGVGVDVMADAIYDPDETVTVTLSSGAGYSVDGSSAAATVTIADDIDAVETVIHQETFQLTGSNGNVDVSLKVTYNAPGAAGLYTWAYTVSNPSSNTTDWTTFSVPVDGMDTDVGNLSSSIGWAGTVGSTAVSWAGGTALTPGSSATFSFTTDPREVGPATVTATGAGGATAQLPVAPAPREVAQVPTVNVSFDAGSNNFKLKLDMTSADGNSYTTGTMSISASSGNTARDFVYVFLRDNGWAVERAGDNGLIIRGKVQPDGTVSIVKTLNWKMTDFASGNVVTTGNGQVTVTND